MPAVLAAFRDPLQEWLSRSFPSVDPERLERLDMTCSDGRILLRRPGYSIPPHRDPKWGFLTCLLYLARPGDEPTWGTRLYAVDHDSEAPGAAPHWVAEERCREVESVEFRPNRMLVFMNSAGAHGAGIPADAPATVERYLYQFRIGPGDTVIAGLLASLPPDRRRFWEGKITQY
jgi:hypothetical protein